MKKKTVLESSYEPQLLAQKLKTFRVSSNLTQKALAELLGLSPQMISCYEAGTANPSLDTLSRYHNYFGADLNYLLSNEHVYDFYEPNFHFSSTEMRLIMAYRNCPEYLKKNVREIIYGGQEFQSTEELITYHEAEMKRLKKLQKESQNA